MPIDKLRDMLKAAGIPYEDRKELTPVVHIPGYSDMRQYPDNYMLNQVIYGRKTANSWKLDAIYNFGSFGRYEGLLELWGDLIPGDPVTATPEEAFEIIKKDWEGGKENGGSN